jgi:hypothetical protein
MLIHITFGSVHNIRCAEWRHSPGGIFRFRILMTRFREHWSWRSQMKDSGNIIFWFISVWCNSFLLYQSLSSHRTLSESVSPKVYTYFVLPAQVRTPISVHTHVCMWEWEWIRICMFVIILCRHNCMHRSVCLHQRQVCPWPLHRSM